MDSQQIPHRKTQRGAGVQQSSQVDQIYECFTIQGKLQTKPDTIFIVMCLKQHFVFNFLNDTQLNTLASQMFYCKVQKDDNIIKQGDNASTFFILERGKIQVLINEIPKKQLIPGNGLGELALLYDAPRSATLKALEDCTLWGIDRATFRRTVQDIVKNEFERNRMYIENIKFFNQLTNDQKDAIGNILISQRFKTNSIIVNKGDQANSFYIIAEGKVGVYEEDGQLIRILESGESFGEQALLQENSVRGMTIKAIEDTKVLGLGRDTLSQILGDGVQTIFYKNNCKWILKKSKIELPISIDKFIDLLQIKKITKGEIVIPKGKAIGDLLIIINGRISLNNKTIGQKGDLIFYEPNQINGIYPHDYLMEEEGFIAQIDYKSFLKQYGEQQNILQAHSEAANNKANKIKDYTLQDLYYIKTLGCGQFGMVYLCKFELEETLFALKIMTRQNIAKFGINKHVASERKVQSLLDHPLIMHFFRSFKDENNIYILNEYIPGIELFDAIRDIGLLGKKDSQFYIAQMILQAEYLHTIHQIIYRDFKPENLVVDDTGYLKLIDFGTAKISNMGQRTFTIIGTPHYMAPEVISGKGYNHLVDLWSIGVMLYEFLCGGLPFGEEEDEPFEIYKQIAKKSLAYPSYMSDKTAKGLIEILLSRIPELRLGGSYQSLKQHAWFKEFQWDLLLLKKLKPVYLPPKNKSIISQQMLQNKIKVKFQIDKETEYFKKYEGNQKDADWDNEF